MRIRTSCTIAILFSAYAAFAAQQAPKQELQQFVVLQSERLVAPFESLTSEQAQCAISGAANFATMRCQTPPGTAKASYHYVTSLVVDTKGQAYVIACHESLLNIWCKKLTPGVAIQGTFDSAQKFLSVADGQKLRQYQTLASADVGPLPAAPPAPQRAARTAPPRAQPSAPAATPSPASAISTATADANKPASGASSSPSPAPSSGTAGTCAASAASCVTFVSEPSGADVYVDGKFVGNTPSSLALPPGSHEIRVEAGDFKPWTRTLSSTAGSTVTIHATLAKK